MNPVIARIQVYTTISDEGRRRIEEVMERTCRSVPGGEELVSQGAEPRSAYMLSDGWVARYKTLEDGRRQITALLVPGDVFDLNSYLLRESDHSILTLTDVTVAELSRDDFEALTDDHPTVTKGLLWQQLVQRAIEREWVVSIGQRSALERIAHLFCEMYLRLDAIGLTEGDSCDFPLVQADLADATGMTGVHLNRVLQQLRRDDLVEFRNRRLTVCDFDALQQAAMFDPSYLHHRRRAGEAAAQADREA